MSTCAVVAGIFSICALIASMLPERRASCMNPVEALRAE